MSVMKTNGMQSKFKRKKILIKRKFQIKFILKVLLPVVVIILLFSGIGLWQISYLQNTFQFNSFNEMVIKLSPQIEKIGANSKTLFSFLNNILVFGGIFLLIMSTLYVVWIFLFFSHRIAGPIFRFEKVFEKLAQGDLTERIYLREKDEFKDVASKYNDTMDNLRERLDEINMYNTELKALLTSLQDQGKIANPEAIQKIFSIHESISKTLKTLKI